MKKINTTELNKKDKEELCDQSKQLIKQAVSLLTGYKRRAFVAQVALDYFGGSSWRTVLAIGGSRNTIELGINELRTGIRCLDNYSARGNKRTEDKIDGLKDYIKAIVEPHTQADPDFRNSYSYLKITAKSLKEELSQLEKYKDIKLPTENTFGNILNRMDYSLKRVQKKTS
jgi:hypothetical protein